MNQTICASSTAPGGAIGIIRLSGSEAINIVDKIFRPTGQKTLSQKKPNTLSYGQIVEGDEPVDDVLVSVFHAPHSYTGENSVEISCHGSQYIIQKIIELLLHNGASSARPGEFTQRAFLNGKIDLSQAEAVADLIASHSKASHRMAMNQMRGQFSKVLADLRERLLHITSLLELELDFSEEDVEFANRQELLTIADGIDSEISSLTSSFKHGQAIKNGVPVAIIGETNAGKSTLLNTLLGDERAIVSNIHGTTRDVIEDTISFEGVLFRFIDTAGIRKTNDEIESIGIERTFTKMEQSSITLWVIDNETSEEKFNELHSQIAPLCNDKKLILVINKCDNGHTLSYPIPTSIESIEISAKYEKGIDTLKQRLVTCAAIPELNQNNLIVSNARHYEALIHAQSCIRRVKDSLSANIPGDLISQDLRECLHHLAEILGGEVTTDEVLGNIFKNFCIGK